jgi:lycopene cyclase domain-containing protein
MYTYLLINLFSISIPFIASFDKRLNFYKSWKYFFPAMLITLSIFIVWDIYFTSIGIWGFNPKYLSGIQLVNLPLEEWMFFITIPYACVFTYDALNYLIKKDYLESYAKYISLFLIAVLLLFGFLNLDKSYTSVTFISTAIFILLHLLVFKSTYLGRFYFTYAVILIPFFIVNGILTGSFIEGEVVWYNNAENLGIRIFTIPIEDSIYGLLLILMNITFLEWFRGKTKIVN